MTGAGERAVAGEGHPQLPRIRPASEAGREEGKIGGVLNLEPEVQGAWVCSRESISLPHTQQREKGAEGAGVRVGVRGGGGRCVGF